MIPILFEKTATTFTTNGIGRLIDCSRCIVTEERNGVFECEFDYPVTGLMFDEITIGRIVVCSHDENGDLQPFDIYKVSEPINGVVTYYACHISYRLNEITVEPFTASSCSAAIAALGTNSIGTNPFTFNTNKSVSAQYTLSTPASLRGLLGGQENSLLDVYGTGEYKFDKFNVYLYVNRGTDTDVSICYGKNLLEFQDELDYSACYNGVVPFWYGEVYDDQTGDGYPVLVTLPEQYISSGQTLPNGRTVLIPMDLSGDFMEQPTETQLKNRATSRLNASYAWLPNQNITVNFVQLWQTEEYKDLAPLQQVKLCDTVLVDVPMYNVSGLRIKIIKVVWNALLDRYDEMQLGTPQATLASTISQSLDLNTVINEIKQNVRDNFVITDNTNQHFWFTSTGTDTGAHITEVDRETFLNNPSSGGNNLLARSNGIAVRNGLTELATFGQNGSQIGITNGGHTIIQADGLKVYGSNGDLVLANIGYGNGNAQSGTASAPYYTLGARGSSAIGNYSMAEGYSTNASAYCSHAEGRSTTASGQYSHAEGDYTTASGEGSHAEGDQTTASGNRSHAEGTTTTASEDSSHAEGSHTTASGLRSHAEGNYTEASGHMSHAGGDHTIADGQAQTAIGKYNVSDQTSLFIIGNGTSIGGTTTRKNALQVDSSGNLRIKGDAYIGCNDDSTGGTLLKVLKVTKSSVSSLPTTISNASITASMECINSVLSKPSVQTGDWTVTTSAGSVSISGSISGSTNITLYLSEPST